MNTAEIVKQCRLLPGVTVIEGADCTELRLSTAEGTGRMRFVPMFPGVVLARISVSAPSWPAPVLPDCAPEAKGPLIINYCLRGRCELVLNDNKSVFLTAEHISLTEKFARGAYTYPGGVYEGFELFIDPETVCAGQPTLRDSFDLDLPALRERYCPNGETFIARTPLPKALSERLLAAQDGPLALKKAGMRTGVIDLLALLLSAQSRPEAERLVYYTRLQVEIAKQIEATLVQDLSRQHTVREFAERFCLSESSIKNYFCGVYGQSIQQYAAQRRMDHAAALLRDTRLPVIAIANRVGYENQSKFSAAFRRKFGVSPREYRRGNLVLPEAP